ncbi:hypothetical protein ElyMa_003014000 [Elysia marginata]|uniref:Uncharacterized protein n=1 Tax=Elysia marginata TaxID=1093978 RepID=A0AAV4IH24_9GAST|nr:hypothetical protein ElyMa_003014000 [Elysia marginata]
MRIQQGQQNFSGPNANVEQKLEAILTTTLEILNQTHATLLEYKREEQKILADTSARLTRLEEKMASSCPIVNETLDDLEKRLETLETLSNLGDCNCQEENKARTYF